MSFLSRIRGGGLPGVTIADDPGALKAIAGPACAAAIWRRSVPPKVQTWLAGLDPEGLPRGRQVLRVSALEGTVRELCDMAQTPGGPERDWLEADIIALAERMADVMGASFVRLRLDAVTTDACRRFHIDAIHARLVCTYRGTGTQYGVSTNGEDPRRVFTVPTGSPIVLRGTLWPETPPSGLKHRSPPIEGTGETRLVLVVDPIFDPEDAV